MHGRHYTPPHLADQLARDALRVWRHHGSRRRPRVIDLACGDGALLHAMAQRGVTDLTGVDLDPQAVKAARARSREWKIISARDALLDDIDGHYDIAIGNPPWVGQVSHAIGADYARAVARRWTNYNAASDLAAAFTLRAAELADQISFIATNTAWEGRTYRSGAKRLLLSRQWSACWQHDPTARYTGLTAQPTSTPWPGEARVRFISYHLYRAMDGGQHCGLP